VGREQARHAGYPPVRRLPHGGLGAVGGRRRARGVDELDLHAPQAIGGPVLDLVGPVRPYGLRDPLCSRLPSTGVGPVLALRGRVGPAAPRSALAAYAQLDLGVRGALLPAQADEVEALRSVEGARDDVAPDLLAGVGPGGRELESTGSGM
jgi:hypothetical protein